MQKYSSLSVSSASLWFFQFLRDYSFNKLIIIGEQDGCGQK